MPNYKPSVEHERRFNKHMQEVVRKEIIKWFDAKVIYPIADSSLVHHVQCVPKKWGMTAVPDDWNDLVEMRLVTKWRVCMDYIKFNASTKKDHFPIRFME